MMEIIFGFLAGVALFVLIVWAMTSCIFWSEKNSDD
jgi:hypothetical protein